jgi:kynurenine formamidase
MNANKLSLLITAVAVATAGWTVHSQSAGGPGRGGQAAGQVDDNRVKKEQLARWMTELSNWGRWGKDDQLGTLNLVTPAKRAQAAALVKTGTTVSLARDVTPGTGARNPFVRTVSILGEISMDRQDIDFHGATVTHLDALCHVSYEGKIYNGFSFEETVTKEGGCSRMGLTAMKDGLVTRGILLDIPRLKGVPYLKAGEHVYREDIEAWEKKAGIKISSGDAILLRTGRWARQEKLGPGLPKSGYDASVAPFLKERDVALLGSDETQDVGTVAGFARPLHRFGIVALGMPLFDNLDLEAVAETAARLKRWEFLVVATPPRASNSTGSPINPIAIF